MWLTIVGVSCIATALYLLLAGNPAHRTVQQPTFHWGLVGEFLQTSGCTVLQAVKLITRLLADLLYFIYAVLHYLAFGLIKIVGSLSGALVRKHASRPKHTSHQKQPVKRETPYLTDEEAQQIQKEIQRQGVVKYLEKK